MKYRLTKATKKLKKTTYLVICFCLVASTLFIFSGRGKAATGTVYPNLDVIDGWALQTGCTITTQYQCVDETGGNNIADYVNTGTSGADLDNDVFEMTSVAGSTSMVTQLDVTVFFNSVACNGSGGSICDTVLMVPTINGIGQAQQSCTGSATNASCTKTYTGTWAGDADLQLNLLRHVIGGGPAASADDDVRLTSVNVLVTYTPNSIPNAPTIQGPSFGGTINPTNPNLLMTTTDFDGDSVKYKIFIYNTTANSGSNCTGSSLETDDQTASGTGWDNGTTAYSSGATATYTMQTTLTRGNGYCFQVQAIDPLGTNTWSSLSNRSVFTINGSPSAPTLIAPTPGATGVSTLPAFQLRSSDADFDILRYQVVLYDSDCASPPPPYGSVQTFDENSDLVLQTGWSGQDNTTIDGKAAYTSSNVLSSSTIATYTNNISGLTAGHTYCWKGSAIDPDGSNAYSSYSSTQSFTTAPPASSVNIGGGVKINGGSLIQ